MVAVANEKLKTAQEAAAQAMRESIEAMNAQDDATMAMLEGFNRVGQEELERVQTQIAAAIAMAVEAKGKIAAALQPGEGEGERGGTGANFRREAALGGADEAQMSSLITPTPRHHTHVHTSTPTSTKG
jgi:uncharacterized protein YlzI (FlbEa/FlbD family)